MKTLGNFTETRNKVTFTFGGWDGTGYNGETVTKNVWVLPNDDKQYVVKYMARYHAYCVLEVAPCNIPNTPFFGQLCATYVNDFPKSAMNK